MKEFYYSCWTLHGHYAGRSPLCFDFIRANLFRKFGHAWRGRSTAMAHRRLRSWGLNTIANWSDADIYLERKTPYVATVHFGGKMLSHDCRSEGGNVFLARATPARIPPPG